MATGLQAGQEKIVQGDVEGIRGLQPDVVGALPVAAINEIESLITRNPHAPDRPR